MLGSALTCNAEYLAAPTSVVEQFDRAVAPALKRSGLAPADVDYVNAHGTGTPANDASEADVIHKIFDRSVPVTSIKEYFGHTMGAVGVPETVPRLEAMRRSLVPASPGFESLGLDAPIHVIAGTKPLPVRTVVTLQTGFGGLNAAAVLRRSDSGF